MAADRLLFDNLAAHLPNAALADGAIVSIDASKLDDSSLIDTYGQVVSVLLASEAHRIVMTEPPEIAAGDNLPGWAAAMSSSTRVYAPTRHRFADLATRDGFLEFQADNDGVLRRAALWQLNDGVMSPSLPLAVAFDNEEAALSHRMSSAEDAIFTSKYTELPRLEVEALIAGTVDPNLLNGATVFIDSSPALIAAEALLPSGQFVTISEITASLLADVEQDRTIIAPAWVSAMEWLAPVLLAIVAVLFMPDRSRKDIAVLTGVAVVMLLLLETLMLYVLHVRMDLGRPILIFLGVSLLSLWLVGDEKKDLMTPSRKAQTSWLLADWSPLSQSFAAAIHPRLSPHICTSYRWL